MWIKKTLTLVMLLAMATVMSFTVQAETTVTTETRDYDPNEYSGRPAHPLFACKATQSTPPGYAHSTTTVETVPSYQSASTTAPFPAQFPCSLSVKNLDRKRDSILFVDAEDRVVFEFVQLEYSRNSDLDDSLYNNLVRDAAEIFASPTKLYVSAENSAPFAIRKHVASSTYEVIELEKDGSFGKVTKISTKGLFKSKYHLEQPSQSESPAGTPPSDDVYIKGSLKGLNVALRRNADGEKSTLIELIKGVHATVAHFDASITSLPSSLSVTYLVATLFAAIDAHREHYLTFTTDEKLDELQAKVRPSTWDSLFLQAGQTSKKQKEFSQQLENERQREYAEAITNKNAYPNGFYPTQRSASASRSRSRARAPSADKSRNTSRTASPAPAQLGLPKVDDASEVDAEQSRGRR